MRDLRLRRRVTGFLLGWGVVAIAIHASAVPVFAADPYENAPPYLAPVTQGAQVRPIITVGQRIPLTSGSGGNLFRFVGIPDGLGAWQRGDEVILTVNHEFSQGQGTAAGPLPSGARVSELTLRRISLVPRNRPKFRRHFGRGAAQTALEAVSGRWAIERLFEGEPPLPVAAGSKRISRLCAATLADERVGFDRPIHLAGEESRRPSTFDGRGGLAFAIAEGDAWTIPRMGRASWESIVALPFTGEKTILFGLEDRNGGHLYMYHGEKRSGSGTLLGENGLDNGSLYVLVPLDASMKTEAAFRTKGESLEGGWQPLPSGLTDSDQQSAAFAAGAFAFVRVEDGAADPKSPGVFYFVTTGSSGTANPRGRLYRLDFDPGDLLAGATLTIVLDGTEGIVSPDNIDINKHGEIAIAEDPTISFGSLGLSRDTSLWIYDTDTTLLTRVAEIARGPARAHALAADPANRVTSDSPGSWEISGVLDAEAFLGRGAWLLDVMAKSLTIAPAVETIQGGQVLSLIWKPPAEEGLR